MCGRFNLRLSPTELQQFFGLLRVPDFPPRYNIAPTQQIVTISVSHEGRIGEWRRWGLIPAWAKDPGKGPPLINARSETIFQLPSFRTAIRKRRCLVPMSGFYEWTAAGKQRKPWHIQSVSGEPLALAGIFEESPPGSPVPTDSCSIVTTSANAEMARLHDRMPVIVPRALWDVWLDPDLTAPEAIEPLMVPLPDGSLTLGALQPVVNNVRNETPECLTPLED